MKLDVSSLEKALSQLEQSLSYLRSDLAAGDPGLRAQFRAAAIQGFEHTYELTVKMMRRQLAQITPVPAELAEMAFKDFIRKAVLFLLRELKRRNRAAD